VRWPDGLDAVAAPDAAALDSAFRAAQAEWVAAGRQAADRVRAGLDSLHRNSYKPESVDQAVRDWEAWFEAGEVLADPGDKTGLLRAGVLAERTKKNGVTPAHPFFDTAEALMARREQAAGALDLLRLRLLRDMAREAGAELRRSKRERRVVSFDDLLYNAWDALRGSGGAALAAALRRRYPAALIDEFQDTDPVQFAVFDAIYGGGAAPLFLVGDPKQAIYGFRNADLHTYLAARQRAARHYTLADNQRSVEGLIEGCNRVFGANPRAFVLGGLDFQPARLGAKPRRRLADRSGAGAAALQIWRLPTDADGRHLLRAEAIDRSVRATAAEIARLLREGAAGTITLDGRGLRAADIAVLVRSHAQAARVKQALGALGIDSVELARDSVFDTPDAEELERVLAAILEPGRTPLLLGACATELMGLDAAAVEALSAAEQGLLEAVTRFAGYRESWRERGFGFMLRRWLEAEGIARRLLARPDGERRLTNLLHLGELLQRAAAEHAAPDALLRWFATRRGAPAGTEEAQLRLESDRRLVQIATIHKSKGLEYDIVFCPLLWTDAAATQPGAEACEYHDDAGGAVIDLRPGAAEDGDIKLRRRREADAESVRLTYVALTRAAQRCYLVAGCHLSASGGGAPSASRSTRSLLNWLAAGAGASHEEWIAGRREPGAIDTAWRALAAAPQVQLSDLPDVPGEPVAADAPAPEALAALAPPARIPPAWRIGSYSSLYQGAEHEAAAADHDERVAAAAPAAAPESVPAHDILRFPRGPAAGECLHALFEHADFGDPAGWPAAADRALAEHPQPAAGADSAPALRRRMLLGLLGDVLRTPLAEGIVLADVPPERRLAELGFHLPAAGLKAPALNAWLEARGYGMPRLAFGALDGYLKGYIDLVFAHGGRYYLLDWKSNHLGWQARDYARGRLDGAMREHGYPLQFLIYSVALHRYLGLRLADYDCGRHFGGVLYMFVRGVRPDWRDEDGNPSGVWFHRPAPATIASLDALLRGAGAEAPS
jgi:exodeoxyribonuclease V beta subunit